jgi:hypothetical protein
MELVMHGCMKNFQEDDIVVDGNFAKMNISQQMNRR